MQEETNEKTIALYIKTGKLTAQQLQKAMKALTAGRVSDKGAEHDKLQKKHEIQSLCLSPQRKRHFETGKYFDCQHQRGRGKSRGRFLDKCDSFADGKKSAHEQRFSVVRRTGSLIGGMTG